MKKKKMYQGKTGPLEWIYILEDGKSMRNMYECLLQETEFVAEYWEDAGVLEVSPGDGGHIDFEQSDEEDVLWVTLSSKEYEYARNAMEKIEEVFGGEFCEDK